MEVSLVNSCRQPLDVFIHPIKTLKQSITLTVEQKKIKTHNSRALGDTNEAALVSRPPHLPVLKAKLIMIM